VSTYGYGFPLTSHIHLFNLFVQLIKSRWLTFFNVPLYSPHWLLGTLAIDVSVNYLIRARLNVPYEPVVLGTFNFTNYSVGETKDGPE
jgi:hypothetical protein